jgi:hypothetical protein
LTSVCTIAITEPTTMVRIATPHSTGCQSQRADGRATYVIRNSPPKAATLVQAAMKPVTGVGAPWYTSGVQEWKGAAPTLNSSPISTMATPSRSSPSRLITAGRVESPTIARAMSVSRTEPEKPYSIAVPNRKNAEEKAPSRKYFSAASCDSSRRRRARPDIRYSGSDRTSNATNIVSRSCDAGNSSIPPMENSSSGKTSDCTSPARSACSSAGEPGTAEACAVNAPVDSTLRSAMVRIASTLSTRIVPWRNRVTPSTTTAPATSPPAVASPAVRTCVCSTASQTTAASPASTATRAIPTCRPNRAPRGTNASTSTASRAAPNTISIGETAA